MLPTLAGIDAIIADPPYGIPHAFGVQKGGGRKGTRRLQFAWDGDKATDAVLEACALAAPLADAHLWFCGLHQASYIADILLDAGMTPKAGSWVKECPPPAGAGNWWPSRGRLICGLHVPWNLQLLPGAENSRKGNQFTPSGGPYGSA